MSSSYVSPDLYGIIGHPVKHSLSPLLHTTAFRELGLPGILLPWDVVPERLEDFARAIPVLDIRGCCVTIPHKKRILELADEATPQARAVGAGNTIYRIGERVGVDNTDVAGFMSPLVRKGLPCDSEVLLLGAGGAARAAVVGMRQAGFKRIAVTSRSDRSSAALAGEFNLRQVPWENRREEAAVLIVNTTPLGMKGDLENETPYPGEWFAGRSGLVYDMIYTPLCTRLLREAARAGWGIVAGLGMFLGQAESQFLRWTGHELPMAAKEAVIRALYGGSVDPEVLAEFL